MVFVINLLIVIASLVVLYFAYFKKNELGKLSVYVIFASILLQELLSTLQSIQLFDFMKQILGSITPFVVYGEIILLVILFLSRMKKSTNKYLKTSLVFLIVVKIVAVLGIF